MLGTSITEFMLGKNSKKSQTKFYASFDFTNFTNNVNNLIKKIGTLKLSNLSSTFGQFPDSFHMKTIRLRMKKAKANKENGKKRSGIF
jgi:hypothetical protein